MEKIYGTPSSKEEFQEQVAAYWKQSNMSKPIGWMLGTTFFAPTIVIENKIVVEETINDTEEKKKSATVLHFSCPSYGVNWNKEEGNSPSAGALAAVLMAIEEAGEPVNYKGESENYYHLNEEIVERALEILAPYFEDGVSHLQHGNILALQDILAAIEGNMLKEELFGTTYGYGLQIIHTDTKPETTTAAMAKFAVVSNSKVAIITDEKGQPALDIVLDGAFGACVNKAWSEGEPISLDYLRVNEGYMKATRMMPKIDRIDRFPVYLEEVIPQVDNIRILAEHNVRFGAIVSAGTTVMPRASYLNFGSGTLGSSMVEGAISSGALIGDGTDIGGAASIQGVLSTGKKASENIRITVGPNSLLGAMGGLGIPLGKGCILDAGVTVLPGTKVTIPDDELEEIQEVNPDFKPESNVVKAIELAMLNGIHIRQDSEEGTIYCYRSSRKIVLNADLH